jgi:hypothetical protein
VVNWREARPGMVAAAYVDDDDGSLHFDIPEILRRLGIPVTPESVDLAAELIAETLRDALPDALVEVDE